MWPEQGKEVYGHGRKNLDEASIALSFTEVWTLMSTFALGYSNRLGVHNGGRHAEIALGLYV